ncbi:MAG: hypothetical protein ACTHQE_11035 [Thermomicrobiales bacterium]
MRKHGEDRAPIVVIVGPCASGKSTLATALRELGLDPRIVAQEHSIVTDLWRRQRPDVLIGLDVDLATLRARRAPTWPASVYASQRERLAPAFAAADLVVDTTPLDAAEVAGIVAAWLRQRGFVPDAGAEPPVSSG